MYQLEISKIKAETDESRSLFFKIPADLAEKFVYKSGQFVTIEVEINGEKIQRCYSLSTSPEIDKEFGFTVKEVSGGKLSPMLVREIAVGHRLNVTAPSGRFVLMPGKTHVFFAAGSGITPIFSMIKEAQVKGLPMQLVYSNKNQRGIIFDSELKQIEKLEIHNILSKPDEDWPGLSGRLNEEKLAELERGPWSDPETQFYLCGPEAYMALVEGYLKAKGVSAAQIHSECFNITPAEAPTSVEDALIVGEGETQILDSQNIKVRINGEVKTIDVKENESVLDAAVRAELAVPYSCMEGVCFACLARLDGGKISMPTDVALDEDEVKNDRKILTCQSRVLNSDVVVNFDEA